MHSDRRRARVLQAAAAVTLGWREGGVWQAMGLRDAAEHQGERPPALALPWQGRRHAQHRWVVLTFYSEWPSRELVNTKVGIIISSMKYSPSDLIIIFSNTRNLGSGHRILSHASCLLAFSSQLKCYYINRAIIMMSGLNVYMPVYLSRLLFRNRNWDICS